MLSGIFSSETSFLMFASIIAVSFNLILGLLVFLNNRRQDTNIIFGILNISLSFYIVANLSAVAVVDYDQKLLWLRLTLFGATFLDTFFYLFMRSFPEDRLKISRLEQCVVVFFTTITALLCLTPWLFKDIIMTPGNMVPMPVPGLLFGLPLGIIFFSVVAIGFIGGGIYISIYKYIREQDVRIKKYLRLILIGTGVMFSSFIVFNLIAPAFLENTYYIKLTPLFTTVFIAFPTYAIVRLEMFNVKVISTELLVFSLWFFILLRTLLSATAEDQVVYGMLLFFIAITGVFLIKSVIKEVDQREELARSAQALKESHGREMEKARTEAKLRDEFVFIAAHELRTPITAIKGFLELVDDAESSFPSDVQSDLDAIKMASEHLNELVNNLLEIARSDAGAMKIETKPMDIIPVLENILKEVNSLIIEKNITVKLNNFKEGIKVLADEAKIKEVFTNLIGNAIKYNRQGGVLEISAMCIDCSGVIVEIRDTGFGIPAEQQAKIFGKFFRASSRDTQGILGTGLGLFITKMLVERMGGAITFSSVEGMGTTFAVSFPKA
jgi:signal transduction histidine kinase